MRISDWSSDVCSSDLACSTFDFVAPSMSAIVRIGVPSRRRSETLSRNHCSSGRGWSVSDSTSVVSTFPPRSTSTTLRARHKAIGSGQSFSFIDRSRSEEHTSELQSLMRYSYDVFCLTNKKQQQITLTL